MSPAWVKVTVVLSGGQTELSAIAALPLVLLGDTVQAQDNVSLLGEVAVGVNVSVTVSEDSLVH